MSDSSTPSNDTGRPRRSVRRSEDFNYFEPDEVAKAIAALSPQKPAGPAKHPRASMAKSGDKSPGTNQLVISSSQPNPSRSMLDTMFPGSPPAPTAVSGQVRSSSTAPGFALYEEAVSDLKKKEIMEARARGDRERMRLEAEREAQKNEISQEAKRKMREVDARMDAATRSVVEGVEKDVARAKTKMANSLARFEAATKQ